MREAHRRLPSQRTWASGASDLVQETFVRAKQNLGTFRGQTRREWRAWLKEILRNRAKTHKHAAARERARVRSLDWDGRPSRTHPSDPHPTPRTVLLTEEQAERMLWAVEQLPETYRTVITMRIFDRLGYAEIAGRMQDGATAESVRKLWGRAIIVLKKMMETEDDSG
jgi:RNA polymerase sigma-70 factor (ECF subfamily)